MYSPWRNARCLSMEVDLRSRRRGQRGSRTSVTLKEWSKGQNGGHLRHLEEKFADRHETYPRLSEARWKPPGDCRA